MSGIGEDKSLTATKSAYAERPRNESVSAELRERRLSCADAKTHDRTSDSKPKRVEKIKHAALKRTPKRFKNPTELQVRLRTGVVYIVVTVACVLLGAVPMTVMLSLTAGVCAGEFYYMLRQDAKLPNEILGIVAAMLYPLAMLKFGMGGVAVVAFVSLIALLAWYVFYSRARVSDVGVSFFGAAYTGMLLSPLVIVRMSLESNLLGGVLVLAIFLSVWANDSFAYLIGSKFGKHKLAPRLSPKKSWEGFAAGLLASILVWCAIMLIPGVTMPLPSAVLIGLTCGLMGVLGDLTESRVKRNSGVKDSGTIMPGHGGLLDRCDSLFLVASSSSLLLVIGGYIPYVVLS